MYNNNNCCYNPCQCNNGRYGNYGYGMEIGDLIITYTGFHYYSYSSNFSSISFIWHMNFPYAIYIYDK